MDLAEVQPVRTFWLLRMRTRPKKMRMSAQDGQRAARQKKTKVSRFRTGAMVKKAIKEIQATAIP